MAQLQVPDRNTAVVFAQPVFNATGRITAMDFDLWGDLLDTTGKYFTYGGDSFTLVYTDNRFCQTECYYSGTITTWFTPQSLSPWCTVQSGNLVGTFMISNPSATHTYYDVTADYSQQFCADPGRVQSGGVLSLHIQ